jgi:hypothetical protein
MTKLFPSVEILVEDHDLDCEHDTPSPLQTEQFEPSMSRQVTHTYAVPLANAI